LHVRRGCRVPAAGARTRDRGRLIVGNARGRGGTRGATRGRGARGHPRGGGHGAPVLALRNVVKRYGSLQVLDGVSLQARRGEVVGIIGPNGAGKTTLLRCIADGRERTSGEIIIN